MNCQISDVDRVLEIGPSDKCRPENWITLDCRNRPGKVDVVSTWGADPLPFPENSFDYVYACHVLEHVPWYLTISAMHEAWRVLRVGGRLEVHVPDVDVLIRAVESQSCLDDHAEGCLNAELHWMHWVAERLFHFGPEEQWHRACFNAAHLKWCFERAGFVDVTRVATEQGTDHGIVDLGMVGVKQMIYDDPIWRQLPHCNWRQQRCQDGKFIRTCANPSVHISRRIVDCEICRLCSRRSELTPKAFFDRFSLPDT